MPSKIPDFDDNYFMNKNIFSSIDALTFVAKG